MKGTVTRKDFFAIWSAFGFRKALRVLFSTERTALLILMG